jgi:transcriptional regulator with XRE-family HTH domain
MTQTEVAKRLEVSQPVLARLESGRSNPRIETLQRAIRATGHELKLDIRPAGPSTDETLIAENLRLEPGERLRRFAASYRGIANLARKARVEVGS